MKKRQLLKSGAALVGGAWFIRSFLGSKSVLAKDAFEVTKTEEQWRKILTKEQFNVLRQQGTERAGTSPLDEEERKGIFSCAGCALPLFSSVTKFHSGTGWPSFYDSIKGAVGTTTDTSFFMTRVEVHCRRCGGHLGHIFEDGPKPTGKRYCINGVVLKFKAG